MCRGHEANKTNVRCVLGVMAPKCRTVHLLACTYSFHINNEAVIVEMLMQGTKKSCHGRTTHPDVHSATILLVLACVTD